MIEQLRRRGIDVTTPEDAGLRGESDEDELTFAHSQSRDMVTRDTDFLRLHTDGYRHSGIVFYRDHPRIVGRLVRALIELRTSRTAKEMVDCVEYL